MLEKLEKLEFVLGSDGMRRYGKNAGWLFAEKALRIMLGFFVGLYVARRLGPAQYGLLSYALSVVWIFSFAASLGLDNIVVRDLVNTPGRRDVLLGSAFLLKCGGALLLLLLLGAVSWLHPVEGAAALVFLIGSGYCFQSLQVIEFYFQAEVRIRYAASAQIAALMLVYAGKIMLAHQLAPLWTFAAMEAFAMAATGAFYLVGYRLAAGTFPHWRFERSVARGLLRDSWPLLLGLGAYLLYTRLDQVMLQHFCGDAAVGEYAIAVRIAEMGGLFPALFSLAVFPAILNARRESQEKYARRLRQLYGTVFYLEIAVALGLFLAAGLLPVFLGEKYASSVPLLRVYCWNAVFWGLIVARGRYLVAENLQHYDFALTSAAVLLNFGLNWLWIPRFGAGGGALAMILSSGASLLLFSLFSAPLRRMLFDLGRGVFFRFGGTK